MVNTVQVTFGANIQPLVDGVKDARSAIETFMAAFAVEKITSFVEEYAKLGEQIEAQSHQFGASTTEVQQLGYVAKMAGGDQQALSTSLGRLEQSLQQAQNPTSRQALALNALGLSARQLIGLPLQQQLGIVADAMAKYADGTNKAAIAQALFRNASGEFIEMLDGGSAGLQRLYQQAINTGAVLSGPTVKALADLDHQVVATRGAFSGLAGTLLGEFAASLQNGLKSVTDFAASITLALNAGKFWEEQIDGLEYAMGSLALSVAHAAQIAADFFKMDWSAVKADWARGEQEQQDLLRQHEAQLAAIAAAGKAEIAKQMAPEGAEKPPAPAINVNARDQLSAMLATINAQVAAQDAYYKQQADHINNLAKTFQISESQKTAMLLAAVAQRESFQLAELNQELGLAGLTAKQRATIEAEITKETQKAALDRQKINEEAVAYYQKEWTSALNTITSSFNSQLRGLLAGTTSWSQAWKSMLGDMIIKFIEMCEQMVAKWAAAQLAQTTATIMGTTARTAAEQGGAATSLATTLATAIKAITVDAAKVFGGVFGFLAPEMGPAAGAVAGASAATVLAEMPSMDVGGYVMRSGLAMVHQGEVIPAAKVQMPYQGNGGGGGVSAKMFGRMMDAHEATLNSITARHAKAMSSFEDVLTHLQRRMRYA